MVLNKLDIIFPPPLSTQMHTPQSLSPLLSSPSLILQNLKQLISNGSFQQALSLFNHLHSSNLHFQISPSILPSLLKASSSNLPFTLQLHSLLLKSNLIIHPPTLNSLLYSYSKHFDVVAARKLFDEMPLIRDPVTWSSMINAYSQNGYFLQSLKIFKEMSLVGLEPRPELVATLVSACRWTGSLSLGRAIHARVVIGSFFYECVLLGTSLIDMYMKFGDLDSGLRVFGLMFERNVVSWTAVINGCVSCGNYNLAIDHLRRMRIEGVELNRVTMVSALQACGELGAFTLGKEIHGCVFKHGFEFDSKVTTSLINMYSKCAGGIKAYLVFERAKERDTITWSSMLATASMIGDYIKTFELFRRMKRDGVETNSITMLAIIDACIGLASLDHGLSVLCYTVKSGLISDVNLGNSLINMFAKCGCLESSSRVFYELIPTKDSISYSSMIQSYGFHGCSVESLRLFKAMQELGLTCDDITILAVLSACNHSGLIEEGKKFFDSMKRDSTNVGLRIEHYACYVDLLGRGGRIEEACEVVRKMPMKPSSRILSSLISACRVHGRFEIAEELSRKLIDLEPKNAANYALVSVVYADEQNWDGVKEIRRVVRERGLRKNLGCSRI